MKQEGLGSGMHGNPDVPWAGPLTAGRFSDPATFAAELTALADRLPDAQPWARAAPGRVTGLEQQLERELTALILQHCGPVTVLAEEHFNAFGGYASRVPDAPGRISFVVDPLDGSKSYLAGSTTYAVTVAGCVDGVPVFGFVYQPSSGTLYSAALNMGAYAGGRRLTAPHTEAPRQAAVRSGISDDPAVMGAVRNLRRLSYRLERMECTSLKFCWVAEGMRAGLVKRLVERNGVLCTWGTAAGQLIASEAGIGCAGLDRAPWRWAAGAVAAGDPRFLADLFSAGEETSVTTTEEHEAA